MRILTQRYAPSKRPPLAVPPLLNPGRFPSSSRSGIGNDCGLRHANQWKEAFEELLAEEQAAAP